MKLVLIEWSDSCSMYGWHDKGTKCGISRCVSTGIVISENRNEITLAPNMSEVSYGDITSIPKVSITRIRKMRVK